MGRYIVYIGYFWFGLQFAFVTMGDFPIQHIDLMTFAFMCDPTTYCACNSWVSVFQDFYSFMYVLGLLSTLDYFFRILLLQCHYKLESCLKPKLSGLVCVQVCFFKDSIHFIIPSHSKLIHFYLIFKMVIETLQTFYQKCLNCVFF